MARRSLDLTSLLEEIEKGTLDFRDLDGREETLAASQLKTRKKKQQPEAVAALAEAPEELVAYGTPEDPHVRQAGAELPDTALVDRFREEAESSLYVFAKAILGKWWLYAPLHAPLCRDLTDFSKKRRKGHLWPRGHGKTTIVIDTLPLHMLIQPKAGNLYMDNMDGSHTRIVMACETYKGSERHIRLLEDTLESNRLLRALWPHRVWPGRPSKHTNVWNKNEFLIPRSQSFPEPSVMGCGVDAAITGIHPNVLIKDDLIGFPRCLSIVEMSGTQEWHETSRNLVRGQPQHLEFVIGTHWTPADIYVHMKTDSTMDWTVRSAIEDGEIIYPEQGQLDDGTKIGFTLEDLRAEEKKNPILFQLNYMNNPTAREIVDFPRDSLRFLTLEEGELVFEEDERDIQLRDAGIAHTPLADETGRFMTGVPFTPEVQAAFFSSLTQGASVRFRG